MPPTPPPVHGARAARALGDPRAVPDAAWVGMLTGASPARVRRVFQETDDLLATERMIRRHHLAKGRDFYAQIRAPLELYALTRLLRPKHILETGVSSGVSSAHFLMGLARNRRGRLHSIDLPVTQRRGRLGRGESVVAIPPGESSGWAMPVALRRGWDLHLGPTQALFVPLVEQLDRVDLFLHDDLHTPGHLTFELNAIRPKLHPGAVVLADNTQWTGDAFDRFARSIGAPALHRGDSDLLGLRVP